MQDSLLQLLTELLALVKTKKLSTHSLLQLQKRFLRPEKGEKGKSFYTKAEIVTWIQNKNYDENNEMN